MGNLTRWLPAHAGVWVTWFARTFEAVQIAVIVLDPIWAIVPASQTAAPIWAAATGAQHPRSGPALRPRDPFWSGRPVPVAVVVAPDRQRTSELARWTLEAGCLRHYWFGTSGMVDDPPGFFDAPFLVPTVKGGRTIAGKLALGIALARAPEAALAWKGGNSPSNVVREDLEEEEDPTSGEVWLEG